MLGLDTIVTIGKQSTAAEPGTLARQSLNVYSVSGGGSQGFADDPILGAGRQNTTDPTIPAPSLDDHRISVRVPLCIAQFGFWCAAFFGTEAVSGSTPDYVHVWKSGAALPYVFLEHQAQSGEFRRHSGLVGESIEIDLNSEAEGFAMATLTFIGMKENPQASALAGTITAPPTLDRPAQALANISYNAVSGAPIIGGKVNFQRKLKRVRGADGTGLPYKVELDGRSALSGSIRVRYLDSTLNADAIAMTERVLHMELMRTAARGIKFNLPHQRLARTPLDISGPDGVEQEITLSAWQTAADAALEADVLNSAATVTI